MRESVLIFLDIMHGRLREINNWCEKEGVKINPSKTAIVLFTKKNNLSAFDNLNLSGTNLKISESAKIWLLF